MTLTLQWLRTAVHHRNVSMNMLRYYNSLQAGGAAFFREQTHLEFDTSASEHL